MATETCEFQIAPEGIYDLIERQTNTLGKALLEASMNSLEAVDDPKKAIVDITFDSKGVESYAPGTLLTIRDNGRGIRDRSEINKFFLTFCSPHSAEETMIWKQFRMGRGQIFSFGKNTWRTSTFKMVVDIAKTKAEKVMPHCDLEYDLPFEPGCSIEVELYKNPLCSWYSIDSMKDELRKQIEFMPGIIRFNGEQLNTPPSMLKWTYEDDDAYYLFNKGGNLAVYNMGAYVTSEPASETGVTGVIVSKSQLLVNFARNAVQKRDCEIWQRIDQVIKANRIKKTRAAARRLNSNERSATLLGLRDGMQTMDEVKTIGLFEDSNGKVLTFNDIRKNTLPWCFAESGDRLADKLLQSGLALCINEDVLDAMGYRGVRKDFFWWIASKCSSGEGFEKVGLLYQEFDALISSEGNSRTSTIVPHAKLTKLEKRIIKVLEEMPYWGGRRIVIGISGCAYLAWTDGSSYIALNREYLGKLSFGHYSGPADLMHTMFHEAAHDEDTAGTHHHGEEFYRRFHEITYRMNGSFYCPLSAICTFRDKIKNAARTEVSENAMKAEKKAKDQRDKALGLKKAKESIVSIENVPEDCIPF